MQIQKLDIKKLDINLNIHTDIVILKEAFMTRMQVPFLNKAFE